MMRRWRGPTPSLGKMPSLAIAAQEDHDEIGAEEV
jgi:hypothetical protein